jgi:hypothetical protein
MMCTSIYYWETTYSRRRSRGRELYKQVTRAPVSEYYILQQLVEDLSFTYRSIHPHDINEKEFHAFVSSLSLLGVAAARR